MNAIKLATEITEDKTSSIDKVRTIYEYIIKNIRYDTEKFRSLGTGYIPDIENTFLTNTGICYDYSALFAAMLRSQGIPAKLVTGYSTNISGYHAWNEVYLEDTKEWVSIDTIVDASCRHSEKLQMIKNSGNFQIKFIY